MREKDAGRVSGKALLSWEWQAVVYPFPLHPTLTVDRMAGPFRDCKRKHERTSEMPAISALPVAAYF